MSITVKAERREKRGKNSSRQIRREGKVPAILYGPNIDTVCLTMNKKDLFDILKLETGENTIFKVSFDSDKRDVMIKDLQVGPVSDEILHVDLIQIAMDKEIQVSVPILPTGDPVGVKNEGGFIDLITREVEIECLPKDIPDHIEVDISSLHLNQSIKVEDIVLPDRVKMISDPNTVLAIIEAPTKEEIVEEVAPEEEEVISEEEEPEVIRKEKEKEEEEKE